MWGKLQPVENDLPKKDAKLENDFYRVYVKQYDNRRGHGAVTRLMIVPKTTAPCQTRWQDYQTIKNEVCGAEREAVEFYPKEKDLRDHGHGYHLWVMPEGSTIGLGFETPNRGLRIYIDAGAHEGVTTQAAIDSGKYDICYAFEPSKDCLAHPRWSELKKNEKLNLIRSAVWSKETDLDWFTVPGKPRSQSASVMREKNSGGIDTNKPAGTVRGADFAAWLKRTVRMIDHVHLKMDIEGAEFVVLEHMIQTGAMSLIDTLTIEWHATKLDGPGWQSWRDNIKADLDRIGVEVLQSKDTDLG